MIRDLCRALRVEATGNIPLITGGYLRFLHPCARRSLRCALGQITPPRGVWKTMRASERERHWRRRVYWYLSPF